jgi:hypothetical protein
LKHRRGETGKPDSDGGRGLLLGLVVAGEAVDTRLDQNQTEFGVNVLAVLLLLTSNAQRAISVRIHRGNRCG